MQQLENTSKLKKESPSCKIRTSYSLSLDIFLLIFFPMGDVYSFFIIEIIYDFLPYMSSVEIILKTCFHGIVSQKHGFKCLCNIPLQNVPSIIGSFSNI
jgi:hypothetical protein